jgi:hypothetical protein
VWLSDRQVSSDDQHYNLSVLSAGKSRDMFDSVSRVIATREWEWISMGEFITLDRIDCQSTMNENFVKTQAWSTCQNSYFWSNAIGGIRTRHNILSLPIA